MPFTVLHYIYRKPALSPSAFQYHYESKHMPMLQSVAGPHFPKTHTRRYIQRSADKDSTEENANTKYPATALVGTPAHFEYNAIAVAFQTFFGHVSQPEAAKRIAEDEEMFMDRVRMRAVVIDDCVVTTKAETRG